MARDIIHSFSTGDDVAKAVADRFITYTNACIAETGSCVVAVSGGTTPNALFSLLDTDAYTNHIDWEHIFFLWVDERFVPQSNPDNNFGRAKDRLFGNIMGAAHYYPVPTNNGTVEEAADKYEQEVKMVLKRTEKETIDLVLLGLGDDGHTASLFPKSDALYERDRLVVAVKDGKVWDRVTLTFPVLETAKSVWFTVVGSSKEAALARVLRQRAEYEEYSWEDRVDHCLPGAVLTHDPVEWYVDESAYSKQ